MRMRHAHTIPVAYLHHFLVTAAVGQQQAILVSNGHAANKSSPGDGRLDHRNVV
jgi:hypothetical protein